MDRFRKTWSAISEAPIINKKDKHQSNTYETKCLPPLSTVTRKCWTRTYCCRLKYQNRPGEETNNTLKKGTGGAPPRSGTRTHMERERERASHAYINMERESGTHALV